jgi:hypothetical protein
MERREHHGEFEALALRRLAEQDHRLLDEVHQIQLDRLQRHAPGFDLGEVEHVVDDAEQKSPRTVDGFGPAVLLGAGDCGEAVRPCRARR